MVVLGAVSVLGFAFAAITSLSSLARVLFVVALVVQTVNMTLMVTHA